MKRAPFVMLAAAVLSLPALAQEPELALPPTTLAQMDLRGPVRSVEVSLESTTWSGETVHLATRMSFDRAGRLVEEVLTEDGAPLKRTVYTYDEKGRSTGYREESRSSTSAPFSLQRVAYLLDSQGRVLAQDRYDSAGVAERQVTYHRDAAGRLTGWSYASGGRHAIEYDARGERISQRYYGTPAWLNWEIEKAYDDAGRLVEERQFERGELQRTSTFRYDERGRLVERVVDSSSTLFSYDAPASGHEVYVYAYSDDGRSKETTLYTPDGALKEWTAERFDERGKLLERAKLAADGDRTLSQVGFVPGREIHTVGGTRVERWEYDRHGNWTCRSVFVVPAAGGPAPRCVETQIITYW